VLYDVGLLVLLYRNPLLTASFRGQPG